MYRLADKLRAHFRAAHQSSTILAKLAGIAHRPHNDTVVKKFRSRQCCESLHVVLCHTPLTQIAPTPHRQNKNTHRFSLTQCGTKVKWPSTNCRFVTSHQNLADRSGEMGVETSYCAVGVTSTCRPAQEVGLDEDSTYRWQCGFCFPSTAEVHRATYGREKQ